MRNLEKNLEGNILGAQIKFNIFIKEIKFEDVICSFEDFLRDNIILENGNFWDEFLGEENNFEEIFSQYLAAHDLESQYENYLKK